MRYIKGYRIIDIPLGTKIEGKHSIYVKEHKPSSRVSNTSDGDDVSSSSGKVLFIGNVDYRIEMSHQLIDGYLRLLFSRFGDIKSITVSEFTTDQSANTRFSHLTFTKKSSLKFALEATDSDYQQAAQEVAAEYGFETYFKPKSKQEIRDMMRFNDVDHAKLQCEVDEFMLQFEEKETAALRQREEELNTADADGFMPVKQRSKRKRLADDSSGGNDNNATKRSDSAPRSRGNKKKKSDKELKNFYRFQIREDKMKELDRLRQKFKEDREKVAKLRDTRQFRPF